jgi:hypothetical protein
MIRMGMDALVLDKPEDMDHSAGLQDMGCEFFQGRILSESAFPDSLADPDKILVDHPTGPHVQMSHFRGPLISVRKSHGTPGSSDESDRIVFDILIMKTGTGLGDGVILL